MKYMNPNNMLGPGDFGHPDEWDDGLCEVCGEEDCTEYCECDICYPHTCVPCGHKMIDGEYDCDWVNNEGDAVCEECWETDWKQYWAEVESADERA